MLLFFCLSILLLLGSLLPPKKQNAYLVTSFIVLFILTAFRDVSVGTDTANYEVWFEMFEGGVDWLRHTVEPGWVFLNDLVIFLGGGYRLLIIFSSLLILTPLFFIAKNYSQNPMLTISLYYLLYFYFNSWNGTRQLIAISFGLFAFVFLLKRKYLLFFLVIAFATLFHKTALLMLPLLFADKITADKTKMIILVYIAMFIGLFGAGYMSSLAKVLAYESYLDRFEQGNLLGNFLFLLVVNSFFIFLLSFTKKINLQVKLFFVFITILNLVIRVPLGNRVVWSFAIFQILFYPYYLEYLIKRGAGVKLLVTTVLVLYCYVLFFRDFGKGGILPYMNILF